MRRRLVPGVTFLLGSASNGKFTLPKRAKPEQGDEVVDDSLNQDSLGTVNEPVRDHEPALFKLGSEEE